MSRRLFFFLILLLFPFHANAKLCTGRLVNPITDICWDCIFPISIGAVEIPPSTTFRPDTNNFPSPICICPKLAGLPIPGIAVGFWEPFRMVDVTKSPFCLVNMGGIGISEGNIGAKSAPSSADDHEDAATWHVHWYNYPLLYILNLFTDGVCLETGNLDIPYLTEFDPLWNNDILSFIINPEVILFANPIAQVACAADCIASTAYKPLDFLFWCSGCQGSNYPLTGSVSAHNGSIQSSSLAVQRFIYKLHRQFLLWVTSGPEAICTPLPAPIIKKSQYRLQTTVPIPGFGPFGCNPFGKSTILHESFKEITVAGEDFGYFVWRKRNCCMF